MYRFLFFVLFCPFLYAQNWNNVDEAKASDKKRVELIKQLMDQPDNLLEISRNSDLVANSFIVKLQDSLFRKNIEAHIIKYFQKEFVLANITDGLGANRKPRKPYGKIVTFINEKSNEFIIFYFIKVNGIFKLYNIFIKDTKKGD